MKAVTRVHPPNLPSQTFTLSRPFGGFLLAFTWKNSGAANGLYYVGPITGDDFELWQYPSTNHVDSSGFTAYTSGGTVTKQEGCQYQGVLDIDGHPYQFSDNHNFLHYYQAFASRQNDILGNTGGQTDLILQVAEADNTQAAMNAITDAR